jgi:hypothetical protein
MKPNVLIHTVDVSELLGILFILVNRWVMR